MKNELTVTREAGQRKCVLTRKCPIYGVTVEIVTTADPQMMVDYLYTVYPGQAVHWRLLPPAMPESLSVFHPCSSVACPEFA